MKDKKFLVISYDAGEQQTFWDWVLVKTKVEAKDFVETNRPYVIAAVQVLTAQDLEVAAKMMRKAKCVRFALSMDALVTRHKEQIS